MDTVYGGSPKAADQYSTGCVSSTASETGRRTFCAAGHGQIRDRVGRLGGFGGQQKHRPVAKRIRKRVQLADVEVDTGRAGLRFLRRHRGDVRRQLIEGVGPQDRDGNSGHHHQDHLG